ncbi:MAG TPA: class I SAM-dependent methyltransferase [Bryobacteraceae bacterium]|jgi:SAM-dependent methyltransferase
MSTGAPYDSIASLYDRHWGRDFAVPATRAIDTYVADQLRPGSPVLDLCCGTGLVLAHLDRLGLAAYGVDESANMLDVARSNAPRATLLQGDMADFAMDVRFSAAVSFYNSLNHARSLDHLRAAIANVSAHLGSGGLFLFDYVLPEAFAASWEWREQLESDGRIWTVEYSYDQVTEAPIVRLDQHQSICQICFTPQQLQDGLYAAGLRLIQETAMSDANPAGGRRLALARKP